MKATTQGPDRTGAVPRPAGGLPTADRSHTGASAQALLEAHLHASPGALSTHTERALRADLGVFVKWCARRRLEALPAGAETLLAFISDMAAARAPATVRRYVASLSTLHRLLGEENSAAGEEVRHAVRRLKQQPDNSGSVALGLTLPLRQRLIEAPGDRLIDIRNRALLAVAYDTLLRGSELVSLRVADLRGARGSPAAVRVEQHEDARAVSHLAPDTSDMVRTWLKQAGIRAGRLFRSLRRNGALGEKLDASQVPRIYKAMAQRAGLPPELVRRLSGNSPRVGAVQDMVMDGVALPSILRAGRWKNATMVQRYSERLPPESLPAWPRTRRGN